MKTYKRGVSIIVLIITIIIMIILAGTIILSLKGENVISRAREAKAVSELSQIVEKVKTEIAQKQVKGINMAEGDFLLSDFGIESEYNDYIVVNDGQIYIKSTSPERIIEYAKKVNIKEKIKLPKEYNELEYIESTGTQYIDTGIVPASIGPGFKVFIDMAGTNSGRNGCQRYNYLTNNYWCLCPNFNLVGNVTIQCGLAGTEVVIGTNLNGERHLYGIDVEKGQYIYDDTRTDGNLSVSYAIDNFYLFADNYNQEITNNVSSKLYSCRFYNYENIIRDFVPAKKSDNTIGLYDLVEGKFYTNSGTGTFGVPST